MCTLENNTTMVYKVDQEYEPNSEGQIKWNDSDLNISWPQFDDFTISEKDDEMNARILKHQSRRGSKWEPIEEPLKIVEVINKV